MAKYEVSFVRREGNSPAGQDWEAFMEEQRLELEEQASKGKRLVSVVPVTLGTTWSTAYAGGRTAGVLLYWETA
jgi:hypothetical protein